MRIYIAGKISGMNVEDCCYKFMSAAKALREEGHFPINPLNLIVFELNYAKYIQIDRILIRSCDAIYLLDNWEDSPGARLEREYATAIGKKILFQGTSLELEAEPAEE